MIRMMVYDGLWSREAPDFHNIARIFQTEPLEMGIDEHVGPTLGRENTAHQKLLLLGVSQQARKPQSYASLKLWPTYSQGKSVELQA